MTSAQPSPLQFVALVVDHLSRLSRDIGDTDAIVKKLEFLGIRIIASRTESRPLTRPR